MIKNIIFDIDGVLTNLDNCYFRFLKENFEEYANLSYSDLPILFPINPHDGAFELPSQFSKSFYESPYYCDRHLFEDTLPVLTSLKKKGLKLYTLSAAGDPVKKRKWLEGLFIDIFNELEFSPAGIPKDEALKNVLQKHNLSKSETIFIDDRFYNIKAGINVGVKTVRKQPEHHLPLPQDLSHIKSFTNLIDFEKYIDELNHIEK